MVFVGGNFKNKPLETGIIPKKCDAFIKAVTIGESAPIQLM